MRRRGGGPQLVQRRPSAGVHVQERGGVRAQPPAGRRVQVGEQRSEQNTGAVMWPQKLYSSPPVEQATGVEEPPYLSVSLHSLSLSRYPSTHKLLLGRAIFIPRLDLLQFY